MDMSLVQAGIASVKALQDLVKVGIEAKADAKSSERVVEALGKLGEVHDALYEMRDELFRLQSENEKLKREADRRQAFEQRRDGYETHEDVRGRHRLAVQSRARALRLPQLYQRQPRRSSATQ